MSKLSQNILSLIQERQLKPRPRYLFLLKNYVLWAVFSAAVILGALAVSTILFMVTSHDWDVYEYLDRSLFGYIFVSLPYLWLVIFVLFIWLAYYYFRHTKHGYRYGFWLVTLVCVLASLWLGVLLFWGGLNSQIHDLFSKRLAIYNKLVYTKRDIWHYAEKGLLAGKIIETVGDHDFMLKDLSGDYWYVANEADDAGVVIQPGIKLKIIGQLQPDGSFEALSLRPWNEQW